MREIRNDIIPFEGFKAINICGLLFVRRSAGMREEDYRHEEIHTLQMRELGYVGFYLWYLVEWLWHLCKTLDSVKAYSLVSFEREAYARQKEEGYLGKRQRWAQWRK